MTGSLSKKVRGGLRSGAPTFIVAVLGTVGTIVAWYLTFGAENRAIELDLIGRANNHRIILENGLRDYWDKLYSIRAYLDAEVDPITRKEFEDFGNSLLQGSPAIMNVAWVPRVTRAERTAHELAAARDEMPDYHIRAFTPDGKLVLSPEHDEYFPKYFSTEARTAPVYGLDLNDFGIRMRTVERIRDSGQLSISPPLVLQIGGGDRRGFWAGVPVYARGQPHDTVEDRRKNFRGLVQGVFQIRVLIDGIFGSVSTPVRIYLFSPGAKLNDLPIYFSSRYRAQPIEARSQAELAAGPHQTFPIDFGDVRWTMVVTPEPAAQPASLVGRHQSSLILLLSGMLITGSVTLMVALARHHARAIESASEKFATQNTLFDTALNNMVQGLLMFDAAGKLAVSNRRFADMFKIPWDRWKTEAPGRTVPEAMAFRDSLNHTLTERNKEEIFATVQDVHQHHTSRTLSIDLTDGRSFAVSFVPMPEGGFVATFQDVTEVRRSEQQISHMAHYDALTDLPNRTLFYEKLAGLFLHAKRGARFAVLGLDLDRFKNVNDTLGHPIGDKLLQAAAARMRACIRETDIVARLGGDEFAIVQTPLSRPDDTIILATRVVEAVSAPYRIDGHQVVVGASIGIALAPDDGAEADRLMESADLALYRCKEDGGTAYRFFEPEMDARMHERHALELDLRKALADGELALGYEPIVNLKTGKVTTCQAAIRWDQPERGAMAPSTFLPLAQEIGLIVPIGEWMLQRACADAAEWPAEIAVAVNVPLGLFKSAHFVEAVANALKTSGLPASRLELQITELVLMHERSAAMGRLHLLRDLGVRIAMDDFATQYASPDYLRSFPFDRIKIDQSFVNDLSQNEASLAILRAVVSFGRSLDMITTAEGVETKAQLEILLAEGCTDAQGRFFSPPRTAAEVKDLLVALHDRGDAKAWPAVG